MTEKTTQASRRKGRGRDARHKDRTNCSNSNAIWPGIASGLYKPLAERDVEKVHLAALTIVEETGIADATEELLDLVLPKGAIQNGYGRLCFPRALVEDVLTNAASEYEVHARGSRASKDDIHCKNNSVYYSNSGTAVTTFDAESKTYRPSTLQDIYDFARLVDKLDNIHMLGDTVSATDVPNDYEHDVNMLYAILAASEKPACVTFRNRNNIPPAIRLFDLASGGEGTFLKKPSVILVAVPLCRRSDLDGRTAAERAGLDGVTFHTLRHTFASWLGQMSGVEALTIRDLLGHSSVTMTDRYMHSDQADIHDAVRKLEMFQSHSGHIDH